MAKIEVERDGQKYYWTGWLEAANCTDLLAQWQCFTKGKLHYVVVSSPLSDTEELRTQKRENGLNSLIEAVRG